MCKLKYLAIFFLCFMTVGAFAQTATDSVKVEGQTVVNAKASKKASKKQKVESAEPMVEIKTAYIIGIGAAFGDSLVYITQINQLNDVHFAKKTNFLLRRVEYSYQLRDFLEQTLGLENRTCSVLYFNKLKKAQKARKKLMERYLKAENTVVETVTRDTFSFKRLDYGEEQ